jgi:hypothetical protein
MDKKVLVRVQWSVVKCNAFCLFKEVNLSEYANCNF